MRVSAEKFNSTGVYGRLDMDIIAEGQLMPPGELCILNNPTRKQGILR